MTIDHDQDVFRAIKAQARNKSDPITEFQLQHVYDIGRRSEQPRITRLMTQLAAASNLAEAIRVYDKSLMGLAPSIRKALAEFDRVIND